LLAALLIVAWGGASPSGSALAWQSKVEAAVLQQAAQGPVELLIVLGEQGDLAAARSLPDKLAKGTFVYQTLHQLAARTQPPLWAVLDQMGAPYRSFWIVNMLWTRGDLSLVQALAQRREVAHIYANPTFYADWPRWPNLPSPEAPSSIEWNITRVNAPQVWAAGYTGQGVVVGGADTGYLWNHPALIQQYRGWDGTTAHHDYNWFDATSAHSPTPVDPYGHGTHTMGIMVGSDDPSQPLSAAHAVGMAPGAQWIGCRNMDASGAGSPATYIACYEWFVAPYPVNGTPDQGDPAKAPHVINNSWSCTAAEGCSAATWDVLLAAVQAVRAAGIVTVHSAGNSGSACSTIYEPAAIYAESFTVGATDSTDTIATFSSRGPVTVDGSNRLKPNVSAPGVGIVSTTRTGGYGPMSGTSMAAPHVAGLAALLISAQPSLAGDVEAIETLIEHSAQPFTTAQSCGSVPGTSIPNNTYGWGRIDAYAALRNVPHRLQIAKTASAAVVAPGETITYTLTITHAHPLSPTTNLVVSDTLPAGTVFLSATAPYTLSGDLVQWAWPSLPANQSVSVQIVVQAPLGEGAVVNEDYGAASADVAWLSGAAVTTQVAAARLRLFLPLIYH